MVTIVERVPSGKRYVLLGVSHSVHATEMRLLGEKAAGVRVGLVTPDFNNATTERVCVATVDGNLYWFEGAEIRVVTVNGAPVGEVLG